MRKSHPIKDTTDVRVIPIRTIGTKYQDDVRSLYLSLRRNPNLTTSLVLADALAERGEEEDLIWEDIIRRDVRFMGPYEMRYGIPEYVKMSWSRCLEGGRTLYSVSHIGPLVTVIFDLDGTSYLDIKNFILIGGILQGLKPNDGWEDEWILTTKYR